MERERRARRCRAGPVDSTLRAQAHSHTQVNRKSLRKHDTPAEKNRLPHKNELSERLAQGEALDSLAQSLHLPALGDILRNVRRHLLSGTSGART